MRGRAEFLRDVEEVFGEPPHETETYLAAVEKPSSKGEGVILTSNGDSAYTVWKIKGRMTASIDSITHPIVQREYSWQLRV